MLNKSQQGSPCKNNIKIIHFETPHNHPKPLKVPFLVSLGLKVYYGLFYSMLDTSWYYLTIYLQTSVDSPVASRGILLPDAASRPTHSVALVGVVVAAASLGIRGWANLQSFFLERWGSMGIYPPNGVFKCFKHNSRWKTPAFFKTLNHQSTIKLHRCNRWRKGRISRSVGRWQSEVPTNWSDQQCGQDAPNAKQSPRSLTASDQMQHIHGQWGRT